MNTYLLRDDQLIISVVYIKLILVVRLWVMGICDISLQNMSLTQNVLNDNLS